MGLQRLLQKTCLAWRLSGQLGARSGKGQLAVFGDMVYYWALNRINPAAYALYDFAGKSAGQKAEYVSKRQCDALQAAINPSEHVWLADDKLRFHERCLSRGLPTPAVFGAVLCREGFLPPDVPALRSPAELAERLTALAPIDLVFKPVDGGHGAGLLVVEVGQGGSLRQKLGAEMSAQALFEHCRRRGVDSYGRPSRGFLIQEFLRPDPRLQPVMPGPALGALRVLTLLRRDGSVLLFYPLLKAPVKGNVLDNFDHGKTGNLLVLVDPATGVLGDGWTKGAGGNGLARFEAHPDTGVPFRSITLPRWEEARALAQEAALAFGELKTVGWDIAIADKGLYLLEANWHYDPDGPQIIYRRGIKSEITAIFAQAH